MIVEKYVWKIISSKARNPKLETNSKREGKVVGTSGSFKNRICFVSQYSHFGFLKRSPSNI
jgi:hypothetical protein